MAAKKHSTARPPVLSSTTKVNTNTKRHGRCAAVAFMAEAVDGDGDLSATLDVYLAGYSNASNAARAGFREIFADALSDGYRGITVETAKFYCGPEFHRGTTSPTRAEWRAHALAWKGGAA